MEEASPERDLSVTPKPRQLTQLVSGSSSLCLVGQKLDPFQSLFSVTRIGEEGETREESPKDPLDSQKLAIESSSSPGPEFPAAPVANQLQKENTSMRDLAARAAQARVEKDRLRGILFEIWTGNERPAWALYDLLTNHERSILEKVLCRKQKSTDSAPSLLQLVESALAKKDSKRLEERLKFVMKRVVKAMIERFHRLEKGRRKSGKRENVFNFFSHYFQQISEQENLRLEQFILPQSLPNCPLSPKTFSIEYLSLLKKSPLFVADFIAEAEHLRREARAEILDKIGRFVGSVFKSRGGKRETSWKSLSSGKLPWTLKEVLGAFDKVRTLVG